MYDNLGYDDYAPILWAGLERIVEIKRAAQPAECEGCKGCDTRLKPNPDANKGCSLSSRLEGR